MDRYETALAPFTKARGVDWEVQITDCDVGLNSFHFPFFNNYSILIKKRLLWNINGMAPPGENTEEERVWKRENRAVPPEEMDALKAKTHGQL
jgi:hypothetical protein